MLEHKNESRFGDIKNLFSPLNVCFWQSFQSNILRLKATVSFIISIVTLSLVGKWMFLLNGKSNTVIGDGGGTTIAPHIVVSNHGGARP